MNLFTIILKNMRQRALATWLTTISVLLGVALAVAILLIRKGMENRFQQGTLGYEMVVGAKGSPLQLVLNTVYNLDISTGNIPWPLFEQLRTDKRVKLAVPFAVGDNYKGFRIIGTTDTLFKEFEFEPGHKFVLSQGRVFTFNEEALKHAFEEAAQRARERQAREAGKEVKQEHHEDRAQGNVFEAVLGATAAQETALKIGETFVAAHGVQEAAEAKVHAENPWKVVGILAPTHTANDRAIFINLDSFYHIEGHEIRERTSANKKQEAPEEKKDNDPDAGLITSIVLKLRSPIHALTLYRQINDGTDAMAAFPASEIRNLFKIVGNIDRILLAQAILVLLVAGVAIAVSIYNSMSERRREIAILRALGAQRVTIFAIVVLEAVFICAIGAVVGLLGGHAICAAANLALHNVSGFTIAAFEFQRVEFIVLAGCILLGALSGLGPALRAYRTEVAENLAPTS